MPQADIGLIGLAVMGQNLILNMNDKGFAVAVFNRTVSKVDDFIAGPAAGRDTIIGTHSLEEFAAALKRPRRMMLMVKAGPAVDAFIEKLLPHLDPGGSPDAWLHVTPIFQAIAAKADDGAPCCDWVGENGAGHFVKMVHNGIEYGDMQLICEAYSLMGAAGMTPAEMSEVFGKWNAGELDSYLIEITRDILAKTDDETAKPMVDVILDTAGQKGTGKWTGITALELGQPLTLIGEAVFARCLSALKQERVDASKILRGPKATFRGDRDKFVEDIRQAR